MIITEKIENWDLNLAENFEKMVISLPKDKPDPMDLSKAEMERNILEDNEAADFATEQDIFYGK